MQSVRAKIRIVACQARAWAEQVAKKDHFDHKTLACFCARGAAELFRRLKSVGFKPRLVMALESNYDSWAHVYVRCCGYIVDITASQFRCPKIIVRKTVKNVWYWANVKHTFTSVTALRKKQRQSRWPQDQIAV